MEAIDASSLAERLRWEQQDYWLHLEAGSPLEKYPAKQHARRVVEKLAVSEGLIYLPGERAKNNEDSDMPMQFRQRRYFYYLSGCNEPNCHLAYDIQSDTLTLFIPRINPQRVIWNGRGLTPAEALDKYDIDAVLYIDQLQGFVTNWFKYYQGSLYILHLSQNPLVPGLPIDSQSLQPAMNRSRVIKDEHEIQLIKKANDISSQAHKEVLANILKFKNETQVEGLFLDVCISKQAKEQAYAPIVASGPNAGTLHYGDNNQDFEDRQLICLDAGCEWQLYASDVTRTFPLSGDWPSEEAKQIYRLVQRMQETCIGRLAPGVRFLDLQILAHQIAIDGLISLGILHNGTREEIFKAGTSRAFFPHGLGHHIGLETHDVGQDELMSAGQGHSKFEKVPSLYPENFHLPVYDAELCRAPATPESPHLEEGMIVTVEPGIYFSAYALSMFYLPSPIHSKYINVQVLKSYLPVGGVRIEDDILITSKGHENLTTAPKGEAMLEIIRSQNAQWPFVSDSADLGPVRGLKVERKDEEDEPLLRAPGIARHTKGSILKGVERAATLPTPKRDRKSVDFEPFDGPSLFSGFKRASTIDIVDRGKGVGESTSIRSKPTKSQKSREYKYRVPVCGEDTPGFQHAYMDFADQTDNSAFRSGGTRMKPACKGCTILIQTLDRLRESLSNSEQGSPKTEQRQELKSDVKPMANSKLPEMTERRRSRDAAIPSKQEAHTLPNKSQTTGPISSPNSEVLAEQATLKAKFAALQSRASQVKTALEINLLSRHEPTPQSLAQRAELQRELSVIQRKLFAAKAALDANLLSRDNTSSKLKPMPSSKFRLGDSAEPPSKPSLSEPLTKYFENQQISREKLDLPSKTERPVSTYPLVAQPNFVQEPSQNLKRAQTLPVDGLIPQTRFEMKNAAGEVVGLVTSTPIAAHPSASNHPNHFTHPTRHLQPKPSLPNLYPQASNNPWPVSNRHSIPDFTQYTSKPTLSGPAHNASRASNLPLNPNTNNPYLSYSPNAKYARTQDRIPLNPSQPLHPSLPKFPSSASSPGLQRSARRQDQETKNMTSIQASNVERGSKTQIDTLLKAMDDLRSALQDSERVSGDMRRS